MEKVILSTKKELEIYMNQVRQQLIRQLEVLKIPMTPKMLADKLDISASSVQHHIKKLMSLGLIELDHTEVINGITASFYKPTYVTVQIGLDHTDATAPQREVLLQETVARTFEGFLSQKKKLMSRYGGPDSELNLKWGDIVSGIVYLTEKESTELMKLITEYLEAHAIPAEDKSPWEYAVILYNAKEELDD